MYQLIFIIIALLSSLFCSLAFFSTLVTHLWLLPIWAAIIGIACLRYRHNECGRRAQAAEAADRVQEVLSGSLDLRAVAADIRAQGEAERVVAAMRRRGVTPIDLEHRRANYEIHPFEWDRW